MDKRITSQFIGTGSFIPERRVKNAEFLDRSFFLPDGVPLDPADNARMIAKFLEITGIAERRWASDDVAASGLGAEASRAAVADADIDPETLDYVIVAHNFGDVSPGTGQIDTVPTLAARIKQKLGIENPACVAYDLPFGCPGWLQGVIQADAFLRSGQGRRALIVGTETLDYVIVAHNFGDVSPGTGQIDTVPTLAARIKQELGIENPACVAYDLPFGCPGWLQGVIQADAFLRSGQGRRALIVGTETLSRVIDPHDRDSMLYADGAGAVVLEAVETEDPVGILGHKTRSDTVEHAQLLRMAPSFDPDAPADRLYLKMEGRRVYEYAVQTVPGVVSEMLQEVGLTLHDVDMLLAHQANAKMNQAILKRLLRMSGLECAPDGMMPMTISRLGNSSVATVPTVFDLVRRGALDGHAIDSGDVLVFASVGAGMNVNALAYRCP